MQHVLADVMSVDACFNNAHKVQATEGGDLFKGIVNIMNDSRQIAAHYAGKPWPSAIILSMSSPHHACR
jgi:hypothetical protein